MSSQRLYKDMQENIKNCCQQTPQPILKHSHPDHTSELARLKKIQGQVDGLVKMISEQRYCVDILVQFRAVAAGLAVVEKTILDKHMRSCVQKALESKNKKEIDQKVEELMDLLSKRL